MKAYWPSRPAGYSQDVIDLLAAMRMGALRIEDRHVAAAYIVAKRRRCLADARLLRREFLRVRHP